MSRRVLASKFKKGDITAPASLDGARLMPTTVKTDRAASLQSGIAHLVRSAAIATDASGATLVVQWECNGGSMNAIPVTSDEYATCSRCAMARRLPSGPVVYRCYAEDGELLYIGSSINLAQRVHGHRMGTRWWDEVADVKAETFPTEVACRLAETKAIAAELPFYNRRGIPQVAEDG